MTPEEKKVFYERMAQWDWNAWYEYSPGSAGKVALGSSVYISESYDDKGSDLRDLFPIESRPLLDIYRSLLNIQMKKADAVENFNSLETNFVQQGTDAEKGFALFLQGRLYESGKMTFWGRRKHSQAMECYKQAVELKNPLAMVRIFEIRDKVDSLSQEEYNKYLRSAMNLGYVRAMVQMVELISEIPVLYPQRWILSQRYQDIRESKVRALYACASMSILYNMNNYQYFRQNDAWQHCTTCYNHEIFYAQFALVVIQLFYNDSDVELEFNRLKWVKINSDTFNTFIKELIFARYEAHETQRKKALRKLVGYGLEKLSEDQLARLCREIPHSLPIPGETFDEKMQRVRNAVLFDQGKVVEAFLSQEDCLEAINKAVDENGNTLLHTAVRNKRKAIVRILLRHGANYQIANKAGRTPKGLDNPRQPVLRAKDKKASDELDPERAMQRKALCLHIQPEASSSAGEASVPTVPTAEKKRRALEEDSYHDAMPAATVPTEEQIVAGENQEKERQQDEYIVENPWGNAEDEVGELLIKLEEYKDEALSQIKKSKVLQEYTCLINNEVMHFPVLVVKANGEIERANFFDVKTYYEKHGAPVSILPPSETIDIPLIADRSSRNLIIEELKEILSRLKEREKATQQADGAEKTSTSTAAMREELTETKQEGKEDSSDDKTDAYLSVPQDLEALDSERLARIQAMETRHREADEAKLAKAAEERRLKEIIRFNRKHEKEKELDLLLESMPEVPEGASEVEEEGSVSAEESGVDCSKVLLRM
jgi:hypothetical protein